MHLMRFLLLLCASMLGLMGRLAVAQQGDSRPAGDDMAQYLGDTFTSLAGGISFRPPAGGTQTRFAHVGTDIVHYSSSEDRWTLKVQRMFFPQPTRLVGKDDPATPINERLTAPGVLDQIARQAMVQSGGLKIIRNDVINIGKYDTGILVCRYTQGLQTWLRQQAVIQASDQLYYLIDYTTPSNRSAADAPDEEDAGEALAVRIFEAVLDSVQLLDQKPIIQDTYERYERGTMVLLVNLPTLMRRAAIAEQFFLVQKDGKDIGWSYVCEEPGERQGTKGFFVASLSQLKGENGAKIDVASEAFCAENRKTEAWVTITVVQKDGAKEHVSEFGQSEKRILRRIDRSEAQPEKGNPNVRMSEEYVLNVTQSGTAGAKNVRRELAAWYVPTVVNQMLPRLLPINEPRKYLFGTWVSSEREVINRFMDVELPAPLTFAGRRVTAAKITDRVGLEGNPTYHYVAMDGKYLGSETPATGVRVIATTQQAILTLFPNATMARPHVLDAPTDK